MKTVVINGVYSVRLLFAVFLMALGSLVTVAPRVSGFMLRIARLVMVTGVAIVIFLSNSIDDDFPQ